MSLTWLSVVSAWATEPVVQQQEVPGETGFTLPRTPPPSAIVNGVVEEGYPAAVGLGAFGFTVCTGSLITPRLVLTAAHCGADLPIELVVQVGRAFFGTDAAAPDADLGFVDAAIHPDYQPLNGTFLGENDVSVLELATDAPVDPVWFRTEAFKPNQTEGSPVISVGFGLDENGGSSIKRSAPLVVGSVDPVFLISYSSGNENNANICSGDSGGPQYHLEEDGTLLQWGVHSWGDLDCVYESGSTRTDQVGNWILAQVERVHGTTDRCAIFGQYGDGVCHEDCAEVDEDCVEPSDALAEGEEARGGCGCANAGSLSGFASLAVAIGLLARRRGPA